MSEPVGVTSDFCDRERVLSLTLEDRKLVGRDIQQGNLGNGLWEVRSDLTDGKDRAGDFLRGAKCTALYSRAGA